MNPHQLFEEYRETAHRAARYLSARYRVPQSEMKDHADFALVLILFKNFNYDPEKGKLKTWVYTKVYWHLKEVYRSGNHPQCTDAKESKHFRRETSFIDFSNAEKIVANPSWIQRVLQEIGEEGAALIRIIADIPQDLAEEVSPERGRSSTSKQNNLHSYLMDVLDWPKWKIEKAFKEVELCLA